MTTSLDLPVGYRHPTLTHLHDYLRTVCDTFGIGLESCTVDEDSPVSAYIALDIHPPRQPDRDLALLWNERHGWTLGAETHSSEDLVILGHLDGSITPNPEHVHRFVEATMRTRGVAGTPAPASA